jgi:hypothetical protein
MLATRASTSTSFESAELFLRLSVRAELTGQTGPGNARNEISEMDAQSIAENRSAVPATIRLHLKHARWPAWNGSVSATSKNIL